MSRSRKKPIITITPKWNKDCEHSFRHRTKQSLAQFDPDRDWEEVNLSQKGLEEYGTRMGWDVPLDDDADDWEKEHYEKATRK